MTTLNSGKQLPYALLPGSHAWVHVLTVGVCLNGHEMNRGDAAALSNIEQLTVKLNDQSASEVLFLDLA
jgi:redox-sensitive bicupin YhaK (pirin superfamily)